MEITRRDALIGALLPVLHMAGRTAVAQSAQTPPPPLFQQDLPNVALEGWQVTATEITLAPGAASRAHRHPGFVLVYIIEGEVVARISGGAETTYRVGQMFYEQPGSTHEVNRNPSATRPARFLAMIFAKKGEPLTTPA
jgi:quercetin dioxygenase-like cupin family protein